MKVEKCIIITEPGRSDKVFVHTDLPGLDPDLCPQTLVMTFRIREGKGVDYVKTNFVGVDIQVIKRTRLIGVVRKE